MPVPPKEKAIEIISKTISNVVPKIKEKHLEIIATRITNNEQFEAAMRKFGK